MVSLKVWNGSALKDPDMIIAKGSTDTLFEVNYVVVNNSSQNPVTVWQAISQTTRSTTTTFDTSQSTTTTFDTSNATTTTFSTSNSTTTTFNTSKSTTTSFNTSRSTTTSFNTSRSTTTSFNTSRSTTTSFNTSRSTSRTTSGSYTPYYVSVAPPYYGLYNLMAPYSVFWNSASAIFTVSSWSNGSTFTNGGYTYQVSTSPPFGALMYGTMYKIRRYLGPYTTSYTTTFGTSRSTTTTFGTSRSTTTTFGTSRSTTTTFGTSKSTTTTFSTSNSTTTTFDTSNSTTTTFSTSNSTTTTFSTSTATDTTIFVRLTGTLGAATSTETEVASADATNVRYWDGDSWEED